MSTLKRKYVKKTRNMAKPEHLTSDRKIPAMVTAADYPPSEPTEIRIMSILEEFDPISQNAILETVVRMVIIKREEEKNESAEKAERAAKTYYQLVDLATGGWQNGMNKTGQASLAKVGR